MGFAQELRDFAAGFKSGYEMSDKFTDADATRKAERDKRGMEAEEAKINEEARVKQRAGSHTPGSYTSGGGPDGDDDFEPTARTKALEGVDRSDPGLYAEGTPEDTGMDARPGVGDDGINNILKLVRQDSGNDYGALTYKKDKSPGGRADLENMTIADVFALQDSMRGTHASTAVGGYQIIQPTLKGAVERLGLDPAATKFTRQTQDQIAADLVRQRGYDKFRRGEIDEATFGNNLASEWAILKGADGRGRYDGFNGNRASIPFSQTQGALRGERRASAIPMEEEPVQFANAGGMIQKPAYYETTAADGAKGTQRVAGWNDDGTPSALVGGNTMHAAGSPEAQMSWSKYYGNGWSPEHGGDMYTRNSQLAYQHAATPQSAIYRPDAQQQAIPTAPTQQAPAGSAPPGTGGIMQPPATPAQPDNRSALQRFRDMRAASAGRRAEGRTRFQTMLADMRKPKEQPKITTGRVIRMAEGGMVPHYAEGGMVAAQRELGHGLPDDGRWKNWYSLEDHPDLVPDEGGEPEAREFTGPRSIRYRAGEDQGEPQATEGPRRSIRYNAGGTEQTTRPLTASPRDDIEAEENSREVSDIEVDNQPGVGDPRTLDYLRRAPGDTSSRKNLRYGKGENMRPREQQGPVADENDRGGERQAIPLTSSPRDDIEAEENRREVADVRVPAQRAISEDPEIHHQPANHPLPPRRPSYRDDVEAEETKDAPRAVAGKAAPAAPARRAGRPAPARAQAKAIPETPTESVSPQGYDTHDNSGGMIPGAIASRSPVIREIAQTARSTGNAEPIRAGMNYVNAEFSKLQGGVPTPEQQRAIQAFATGRNAPPVDAVVEARSAVDPQGEFTPDERAMMTLQAGYQYYMKLGQPDKAAKYAGELLMYSRAAVMKAGYMAQAALERGDVEGAKRMVAMGHSEMPTGEGIKFTKNGPDGSFEFAMFDASGKLTNRGRATADMLMQVIPGMQSGAAWMDAMWERMGPRRAVDPSNRPMTPYQQERTQLQRERLELDRRRLEERKNAPASAGRTTGGRAGGTAAERKAAEEARAAEEAGKTRQTLASQAEAEAAQGNSPEYDAGRVEQRKAALADHDYKQAAEDPLSVKDRRPHFDDIMAEIDLDEDLKGWEPGDKQFVSRGADALMRGNGISSGDAVLLMKRAMAKDADVRVEGGRLMVDGRALKADGQTLTTIASLRAQAGRKAVAERSAKAGARETRPPARREATPDSRAQAVGAATDYRRRNMMDER